jgi:hypothetical protein
MQLTCANCKRLGREMNVLTMTCTGNDKLDCIATQRDNAIAQLENVLAQNRVYVKKEAERSEALAPKRYNTVTPEYPTFIDCKLISHKMESRNFHYWMREHWYTVAGDLEMCNNGFHFYRHPLFAEIFGTLHRTQWDTELLVRIETMGEVIHDGCRKSCAKSMRVTSDIERDQYKLTDEDRRLIGRMAMIGACDELLSEEAVGWLAMPPEMQRDGHQIATVHRAHNDAMRGLPVEHPRYHAMRGVNYIIDAHRRTMEPTYGLACGLSQMTLAKMWGEDGDKQLLKMALRAHAINRAEVK